MSCYELYNEKHNKRKPIERFSEICNAYDLFHKKKEENEEKEKKIRYIFRGENYHADCGNNIDEALMSSLDKAFERFQVGENDRHAIEEDLYRSFRRRAPLYCGDKSMDMLEAVALLRHYEGPARMLDWTYSLFVALFWAVARAKPGDSLTIWAINNTWLAKQNWTFEKQRLIKKQIQLLSDEITTEQKEEVEKKLGKSDNKHAFDKFLNEKIHDPKTGTESRLVSFYSRLLYDPTVLSNKGFHDLMYLPWEDGFIYAVNPFCLNERLSIQQGVLLVQGHITKSWGANLREMVEEYHKNGKNKKYDPLLWRIDIELDIDGLKDVLNRLHDMNISLATLYPDISGFAQSLNTYWEFLTPH